MAIGGMTLGNERNTNIVRFHRKWMKNEFKTKQTGKLEGDYFDYIEIRGLGQDKAVNNRKVGPKDQADYAREWDLYQRGLEQAPDGIPIEVCPLFDKGDIDKLKSLYIPTVESLVNAPDGIIIDHKLRSLQDRARKYLEAAPKTAAANLSVQVDDLRAENERLQTENAQFKARIEEIEEAATDPEPKRGPGRPRTKTA